MPLSVGAKIGPYEIIAAIGRGGMGEVWKARDTRLDRIVAIKFSGAEFSERFGREAKAIAALNHSNICQIYDVGPDYIVMEYVEGAPITPVDTPRKLLDIAVQMSDGLAAAHAAGIVHRDLKPDNVLITRDGRVKILDFGLAKAAHGEIGADDATRTIDPAARALTDPGTTVGTVAYMSPEQARGQTNLTAQSDQFSLGRVLYELAAGKRAFRRGAKAETMTAIIREDAEPLPATVPAPLRWVIERLLQKEPAERYDSSRDLYRELRYLRDHLSESASASAIPAVAGAPSRTGPTIRRRATLGIGLAAALVCGVALAALLIRPPAADFSAYKFKSIARDEATERYPKWSPDGKNIAYTAEIHGVYQIFTKGIDSSDTAQLTHAADPCIQPFWSPDGTTIYYISHGNLWSVGASGGTPELVMENASSAALHPDGKTVAFLRDGKLWAGPLRGGSAAREIGLAPDGDVTWMAFSPDGSRLAAILLRKLWIPDYPSGASRNLGIFGQDGSWFPDSRHLVANGGNFHNTMFVVDSTDGSSRVIYRVTGGLLHPSVSPDGKKILYGSGAAEWDVLDVSLADGHVHTLVGGGGVSWQPDWAPSGTHYLFSTFGDGSGGGIVDRSATEAFSRRVADAPPGSDTYALGPQWSPDGTRFLFAEGLVARMQLAVANASGRRPIVLTENVLENAHGWSPDGQWVVFMRHEGGKEQVVKMKPAAGATPLVLASGRPATTDYSMIQWSPAGDWIAYRSADGTSMISPDGKTVRILTARNLLAFTFSKNGAQVYGVVRNTAGQGALWQLYSIDVKSGAERLLAPLDFPAYTANNCGIQPAPGRQALPHIHREMAVRYLDARRLRSAQTGDVARPVIAAVTGKWWSEPESANVPQTFWETMTKRSGRPATEVLCGKIGHEPAHRFPRGRSDPSPPRGGLPPLVFSANPGSLRLPDGGAGIGQDAPGHGGPASYCLSYVTVPSTIWPAGFAPFECTVKVLPSFESWA
jgi:serine/threonine protein kinase